MAGQREKHLLKKNLKKLKHKRNMTIKVAEDNKKIILKVLIQVVSLAKLQKRLHNLLEKTLFKLLLVKIKLFKLK